MGRSKRRTRVSDSNRRLRSDSFTAPISYVPYGSPWGPIGKGRSSPSPTPSRRANARRTPVYDTRRPLPQRPRSGSPFSQGVWVQATPPISPTPKTHRPDETMVCVNRSQRREVLHALQKTGKAGQKSPVYNRLSKIHCKKRG